MTATGTQADYYALQRTLEKAERQLRNLQHVFFRIGKRERKYGVEDPTYIVLDHLAEQIKNVKMTLYKVSGEMFSHVPVRTPTEAEVAA